MKVLTCLFIGIGVHFGKNDGTKYRILLYQCPLISLESLDMWFICVSFLFMLLSRGQHVCKPLTFSLRALIWPFGGPATLNTHLPSGLSVWALCRLSFLGALWVASVSLRFQMSTQAQNAFMKRSTPPK